jgi:hypothetical protein
MEGSEQLTTSILNQSALDREQDYCGHHRKDDQAYGSDCIYCQTKRLARLEPLLRRVVNNQKAMAKVSAKLREENRRLQGVIQDERDTMAAQVAALVDHARNIADVLDSVPDWRCYPFARDAQLGIEALANIPAATARYLAADRYTQHDLRGWGPGIGDADEFLAKKKALAAEYRKAASQ